MGNELEEIKKEFYKKMSDMPEIPSTVEEVIKNIFKELKNKLEMFFIGNKEINEKIGRSPQDVCENISKKIDEKLNETLNGLRLESGSNYALRKEYFEKMLYLIRSLENKNQDGKNLRGQDVEDIDISGTKETAIYVTKIEMTNKMLDALNNMDQFMRNGGYSELTIQNLKASLSMWINRAIPEIENKLREGYVTNETSLNEYIKSKLEPLTRIARGAQPNNLRDDVKVEISLKEQRDFIKFLMEGQKDQYEGNGVKITEQEGHEREGAVGLSDEFIV